MPFLVVNCALGLVFLWTVHRDRSPVAPSLIGSSHSEIAAKTLGGASTRLILDARERHTLVYVFSPSCVWCRRNERSLAALATALRQSDPKTKLVALSLSGQGLEQYIPRIPVEFDVIFDPEPDSVTDLSLRSTPRTILFDARGTLIKDWSGAYTPELAADISQYFGILVPPIAEIR